MFDYCGPPDCALSGRPSPISRLVIDLLEVALVAVLPISVGIWLVLGIWVVLIPDIIHMLGDQALLLYWRVMKLAMQHHSLSGSGSQGWTMHVSCMFAVPALTRPDDGSTRSY